MAVPTVSIVLATPVWTARQDLVLTSLLQQVHPAFEIVIVCPNGAWSSQRSDRISALKHLALDDVRLPALVNAGIAASAGELVALIDPDAVAEPFWLARLAEPVSEGSVSCAIGLAAEADGVDVSPAVNLWTGDGQIGRLDLEGPDPVALSPLPGRVPFPKPMNLVAPRAALAGLGGLDTDLDRQFGVIDLVARLLREEPHLAVVPDAVVHSAKSLALSAQTLSETGAGAAAFLRKSVPFDLHDRVLARLREQVRQELVKGMLAGHLDPGQVFGRMASYNAGVAAGLSAVLHRPRPLSRAAVGFQPSSPPSADILWINGRRPSDAALKNHVAKVRAGSRIGIRSAEILRFASRLLYVEPGIWLALFPVWRRVLSRWVSDKNPCARL